MQYGDTIMKLQNLEWCKKQVRGLKLVAPNANLTDVYIKKAESALNMLASALEKNEVDWVVTTSYYAKYFALYSIFAKCGIKCEIHDCTIAAMKILFVDQNLMSPELYNDLEESKNLRTELQYYAYKEFDKEKVLQLARSAAEFVLKMQEYLQHFGTNEIELIRKNIFR